MSGCLKGAGNPDNRSIRSPATKADGRPWAVHVVWQGRGLRSTWGTLKSPRRLEREGDILMGP